ncbi:NAD(P)/FAD-dependent oxidoreductase [Mycobacterium sp. NBC_00419]|uniref:NAD(P)/FAD-dependent oxidoreductase n=1 Tax=Mycobacterium sp. NBC_00419 TaxID=2975989 RepID=UPI002E2190CE
MNSVAQHLDTDYLILGAGAMGMAFADVILNEDPAARIVIVDRRANPGGHWNDAYPFVRLHQPAEFYGLNSTALGQGGADLSSGPEIVAYFRRAMDAFLATGRVTFLPMSEHQGDGRVVSTVDGDRVTTVTARRRIVDATFMNVTVPSVCPPRYSVDPGVNLIPPNGLARIGRPPQRYVVIGAGKTGMDSILFLLDNGVAPERIQWIMSQDAWLLNRAAMQPGIVLDTVVSMMQSLVDAASADDIFLRLERQGLIFRLDTHTLPTKWRCATVDAPELGKLRRIDTIVRMGRVQRVGSGEILLDRGSVDVLADSLFVDCSADGLAKVAPQPLFSPGRVTLQPIFMCQQTFSAALIAHLELLKGSDERRNRICTPVPHPQLKEDISAQLVTTAQNMINCNRHIPVWLRRSRLYLGHHCTPSRYLTGSAKILLLQRRAVAAMNRVGS